MNVESEEVPLSDEMVAKLKAATVTVKRVSASDKPVRERRSLFPEEHKNKAPGKGSF